MRTRRTDDRRSSGGRPSESGESERVRVCRGGRVVERRRERQRGGHKEEPEGCGEPRLRRVVCPSTDRVQANDQCDVREVGDGGGRWEVGDAHTHAFCAPPPLRPPPSSSSPADFDAHRPRELATGWHLRTPYSRVQGVGATDPRLEAHEAGRTVRRVARSRALTPEHVQLEAGVREETTRRTKRRTRTRRKRKVEGDEGGGRRRPAEVRRGRTCSRRSAATASSEPSRRRRCSTRWRTTTERPSGT